jgi:hypothetical protein
MVVNARLTLILLIILAAMVVAEGTEYTRIVPAKDVLDNITAGRLVEYNHIIIKGDLNLGKLKLPITNIQSNGYEKKVSNVLETAKEVRSLIRITDSLIDGSVDFSNIIFKNQTDFDSTTFNSTAQFSRSAFNSDANFFASKFNSNASFFNSKFKRYAVFTKSAFNSDANFRGSTFNSDVYFITSKFNHSALFTSSTFNSDTYFRYSTFTSKAQFNEVTFNNDADFRGSTFNSDAYFITSKFNHSAFFNSAIFNSTADFGESVFNKGANFNDAQFQGFANFNISQFKEDAFFEKAIFEDKICLTRASYSKLYIRWNNIKKGLFYDDYAYLALIKNFKDLNYLEDSDNCYFQYRKDHRGQPWSCYPLEEPGRKFIDFLSEWAYGYGTRPENPFLGSVLLIGLFGLAWKRLGFNSDRNSVKIKNAFFGWSLSSTFSNEIAIPNFTLSKKINNLIRPKLQSFLIELEPFSFSAIVFLSGARFLIDAPEIPIMPERSKHLAKRVFNFERILGAIFTGLFLLAIGRTVIRTA